MCINLLGLFWLLMFLPPLLQPVAILGIPVYLHAPISLRLLMEVGAGKVVQGPKGYAAAFPIAIANVFC